MADKSNSGPTNADLVIARSLILETATSIFPFLNVSEKDYGDRAEMIANAVLAELRKAGGTEEDTTINKTGHSSAGTKEKGYSDKYNANIYVVQTPSNILTAAAEQLKGKAKSV